MKSDEQIYITNIFLKLYVNLYGSVEVVTKIQIDRVSPRMQRDKERENTITWPFEVKYKQIMP